MVTSIRAARIWGHGTGTVNIADGRIVSIDDSHAEVDLGGRTLIPGLVDLQVNGLNDTMVGTADTDQLARLRSDLASRGTTTFLATLLSDSLDGYASQLERIRDAGIEGVHMEGPFLGERPGAHEAKNLVAYDADWQQAIEARFPGLVRILTVAPEADPESLAPRTSSAVVSMGHSACTLDRANEYARLGAAAVTHTFNAMSGLKAREPGLAGAALFNDSITPMFIADGVHVHPELLRFALNARPDAVIVSDIIGCTSPEALARGVEVAGGAPRLPDGTLAGASKDLAQVLPYVVRLAGESAVDMVTARPARLAGFPDRGRIAVGNRADIVCVNESFEVERVWCCGVEV